MQYLGPPKPMMSAKLPFMTPLPKKRGITQVGEDKSLILRSEGSFKNYSTPSAPGVPLPIMAKSGE
jgi:hypothetical protein